MPGPFPEIDPAAGPLVCRFGKRNLDGMSFLAPLVNNRVGDLLNLELRHEQLFFIQGDRVISDIGYSEKGQRFSEADFGKPIHTLEDLKKNGYWLIGRNYDPAIMREALEKQQDGLYYSLLSNQCQDWTDRLRRAAERLEKKRGMAVPGGNDFATHYVKPVSPTEPASIGMGVIALLLGLAAILSRYAAGYLFTIFIGLVFLLAAGSHILYGLHARDWRNMLSIFLLAFGLLLGGVLILLNRQFATVATGSLLAILIACSGVGETILGVTSRPLRRGLGPLAGGLFMLACAGMILLAWPDSTDAALGLWVGLALIAGGWSTIWLSWTTRQADASPVTKPA